MTKSTDQTLLAQALGEPDAALLLPFLDVVTVADGTALLTEGAPSRDLYLLTEGELTIVHESPQVRIVLGQRPAGSWIGEVGVVDHGPASVSVIANGPCRLLRIDHAALIRLADDRPDVASVLLRHITRQLAERIASSSSGILEQIAPGQTRVRKPEAVRGWAASILGWLTGGAR